MEGCPQNPNSSLRFGPRFSSETDQFPVMKPSQHCHCWLLDTPKCSRREHHWAKDCCGCLPGGPGTFRPAGSHLLSAYHITGGLHATLPEAYGTLTKTLGNHKTQHARSCRLPGASRLSLSSAIDKPLCLSCSSSALAAAPPFCS